MRHQNKVKKLGRKTSHRRSLLSNLVCSLIEHKQIRTTLAKAKAVRPFAEKMVTLGKRGDLHARRQAVAFLHQQAAVQELFKTVAPLARDRKGGYTRITKLGQRLSDSAPMAFIEWVDQPAQVEVAAPAETEGKAKKGKSAAPAATEEDEAKSAAKKKPAAKKAPAKSKDKDAE